MSSTAVLKAVKKKQSSPAKNWCFTLNRYSPEDVNRLRLWASGTDEVVGLAFQGELGEEKTPHLQGHIAFKLKVRPIKKFQKVLGHTRTHLELRKGSIAQNQEYCLDPAKRQLGGPRFNHGFPELLVRVKKHHLRPNQIKIINLFREPEDALYGRKVYWFYEKAGAWGKSFVCKFMVDEMGAYVVSGKNKDVLSTIAKLVQDTGGGPPIIIFDVPRVNEGHVSYQAMESIKNGLFYSGKYEGAMVRMNSPHLIVFSNAEPDRSKLSADRWVIRNLRQGEPEVQDFKHDGDGGVPPLVRAFARGPSLANEVRGGKRADSDVDWVPATQRLTNLPDALDSDDRMCDGY